MPDLQPARTASALTVQTSGFAPDSEVIHSNIEISVARRCAGISQSDLARLVNCDLSSIKRAERGRASASLSARIEQALRGCLPNPIDDSRAELVLRAAAIALAPLLGAKSEWAIGLERRSSRPASRLRRHMARLANAHFGVSLEKIAGVYGCRRQSVAEQVQAAEAEIAADDDLAERIADLFALIEATVRRA
ncbi:MAG: hypothetical protein H6Q99_299 [Proteobacteria bacterium]|nr:hypothetical protein [Pseudomonadota bacterium]